MINYYMPGFYENQPLYANYLYLQANYPECFYDNVKIHTVFGSFPLCLWNGGSAYIYGPHADISLISQLFEWYKNRNINIQLTFTNPLIEETDIYDRYCNSILKEAEKFSNISVLVSSNILDIYIREKYPSLKIDLSVIFAEKERNNYSLPFGDFNNIVLPRTHIKDMKFLESIPKEERIKYEILVNDPCPVNCPRLYSHYEDTAKIQLFDKSVKDFKAKCTNLTKTCSPFAYYNTRQYNYSYEELLILEKMGFTQIKISGRLFPVYGVLNTTQYLIKPEYLLDVQRFLLSDFKEAKYSHFIWS